MHPYLVVLARLSLGVMWIVAGAAKLASKEAGDSVVHFALLPERAAYLAGITLPWVELILGALLILGQWTTLAAEVSIGLLLIFSIAILINLVRGNRVECRCFGHLGPKPISWWSIGRNLLLLAIASELALRASGYLAADGFWRGSLSGPADPPVADFVPVLLIALAMVLFSVLTSSAWRIARISIDAVDVGALGIADRGVWRQLLGIRLPGSAGGKRE